jgi:hypothetical protein
MAAKGSRITRVMGYFREADLDEVRVAFTLVEEIVGDRLKRAAESSKSQTKAAATPRRKRRTKAEMAAATQQTLPMDKEASASA